MQRFLFICLLTRSNESAVLLIYFYSRTNTLTICNVPDLCYVAELSYSTSSFLAESQVMSMNYIYPLAVFTYFFSRFLIITELVF